MRIEYVHPELGKEVYAIAGYYQADEEGRLQYDGHEVLYVAGRACIDSSCCGGRSWAYVQVPGFVARWHFQERENGAFVSEIEPIEKDEDRGQIRKTLAERYPGAAITFS